MEIIEYQAGIKQQNNIAPNPPNDKTPKRIEFTPPQPGPPKQAPAVLEFGQSFAQTQESNIVIRNYLENVDDPMSSMAKIRTTMVLSKQLGLEPDYVYDNYDAITEKISGISNDPQKFGAYVSNQFTAGRVYIDQSKIWADIKNNPDSPRREAWLQEIELLEEQLPPADISDKGWLTGMVGSTANLLPYSWAVGKHLVPGAIATLLSKGLAGKESVALGLSILARFATTAGNANSFGESLDLAGGIIFGDLMQMSDITGEPINEDTARTVANWAQIPYAGLEFLGTKLLISGAGPISDALKKMGAARIKPLLQRASSRALSGLTAEGTFRGAMETLSRGVIKVAGTAIAGTGEEIFEELSQEVIQRTANEIAKEFTNEINGTEFEPEGLEEWQTAMTDTVRETARAVFLLQLPNMIRAGVQTGRTARAKKEAVEFEGRVEGEDEILDLARTATDEEFDEVVRIMTRDVDAEEARRPEITVTDKEVSAITAGGIELGKIDYSLDEDGNILIDKINLAEGVDISIAEQMTDDLRARFPNKTIIEQDIETADTVGRVLQDRDPLIRDYNQNIDILQTEIETAEATLEDLDNQIQTVEGEVEASRSDEVRLELLDTVADLKEDRKFAQIDLDTNITTLARTQEEKAAALKVEDKPVSEMTQDEFQQTVGIPEAVKAEFIDTPKGQKLRKLIEDNVTGRLTPEEVSGFIKMIDLRAKKLKISPEKYIAGKFQDEIFSSPEDSAEVLEGKRKAAITFARDGRVLLHTGELSDFSSIAHELAHLFRAELTGKELKVAYNWAKKEARKTLTEDLADALFAQNQAEVDRIQQDIIENETSREWTNAMEEAFAEGYEKFLWEGQTSQESMKSIFLKFAEYMKRIYKLIVNERKLTPAIRSVFDNLLSNERLEALENGTAEAITPENTFFQSDKKHEAMPEAVVKEAVETFGITYNINEAGYVLPDGRMLDFSGRHENPGYVRKGDVFIPEGRDYLAGSRRILHSDIGPGVEAFLDMGAMRIDGLAIVADIGSRPTSKQYKQLEELAFRGEILVDMADGTRKDYIVSSADFSKIKGQIERFYSGGTINRGMLFQSLSNEYTAAIKAAVEDGLDVPIKVLKQFTEQDWAVKAIEKRVADADMLETYDWLTEIAQNTETFEEFKEEALRSMDIDEAVGDKFLTNFYEVATARSSTIDINEGNKRWIEKLTDEYISGVIAKLSTNIKKARDAGVPVTILAQAERYKANKTLNDAQISLIRKIFRNNPAQMRAFVGEFAGEIEELNNLRKEREFSKEFNIKDEFKRPETFTKDRLKIIKELEDVRLQRLVRDGSLSLDEIDDLLAKSEDVIKADDQQIADLTVEFRETKKEAVKKAIEKTKAERNKHYKDRDAKRKLKKHVRDLGDFIKQSIPTTVALEQRLMIQALKAPIDPNFRRKSTIEKRELQKAIFGGEIQKDTDDILEATFGRTVARNIGVDKKFLESLYKKSLGEIDVEELEFLKNRIKGLIKIGKALEKARKDVRTEKNLALADRMSLTMRKGEPFPDKIPTAGTKPGLGSQATELALSFYRIARITDFMDGGKGIKGGDFKGPIHDFFVNEIDRSTNNEYREVNRRRDAFRAELKRLEITEKELSKVYEIDGIKINAESIMEVYAGYKNDFHRAALQDAHGITPKIKDDMMKAIPPKLIQMADFIIADYGGENYERLRSAFREMTNKDLIHEEFYVPMKRTGIVRKIGVTEDLLDRRDFKRKGVDTGFLKGRQGVSKPYQTELSLGLVSSWQSSMRAHEHYIAMAGTLSTADSILKDKDFRASAQVANLNPHLNELRKYIDRVANPSIYKSNMIVNRLVRHLRRGSSITFLAYNMVTISKQVPSLAYYLGYAGPQDLLSGLAQTIGNWGETRELMERLSPQMKERSVERFIEDLKNDGDKNFAKIINKVGLIGMKGILTADKFVVTAGWKAVYDKARRNGRSEVEAAQVATRATLNTQPAASAKDIASIYAEDNFLSIFLQFTNQLNQQFNILTYDVPQALLHGHILRAAGFEIGMMLSAITMWMLANRRLPDPENPDDFLEAYFDQSLNMFPVVGRYISSLMDGYNYSLPILSPVQGLVSGLKLGEKALAGEDITDVEAERLLWDMAEGLGIGIGGAPILASERIYKGFKNGQPIQTILLGGEIKDD